MIVSCPSCRTQFRLADELFRPGAKMRCARCSHTFAGGPGSAPPTPGPGADLSEGERPLALLADAGRPIRGRLRPALEGLGFKVETADEGTAAFKAAVSRRPAAIVASVHLGGLSGVAICEGVKGSPHLKAIRVALVGSELSSDLFNRDTALAYGADLFLDERMSEQDLRAALASLVPATGRPGGVRVPEAPQPEAGDDEDRVEGLDDPSDGEGRGPAAEIRRLARLMLSDLKLYNPDRFAQAVRDGHVLDVFGAELARGRDLVEQRFPLLPTRQALLAEALRDGLAKEPAGDGALSASGRRRG